MAHKSILVAAALLVSGLGAGWASAAAAQDHRNPVDPVSNPDSLQFSNVIIGERDFTERFQRDGMVRETGFFAAIRPGMASAEILSLLGQPLVQSNANDREWNYNFKFQLHDSQNYLVCQYKILFSADNIVKNSVWRRRQCKKTADGY